MTFYGENKSQLGFTYVLILLKTMKSLISFYKNEKQAELSSLNS